VLDVPFNPSHPSAPAIKLRPLVITLHDLTPLYSPVVLRTWRYRLFYRFSLWLARRADALILDSEASRQDALRAHIARRRNVFVAHLAAVVEPTERHQEGTQGRTVQALPPTPYVLHVGSSDWNKNRDGVLEAFDTLSSWPNLSLVLVSGDESWKSVLSEDLHSRVFHYPQVDRASLNMLYAGASAFVFPSRYEGFGLPILEAMMAGTPVVTSDRGAMREIAGPAALLVDPESPQSIADAVRRILQNSEIRGHLVSLGRERASMFSWDTTARITLEAYAHALRASRRRAE
jgi:glycosyltransferase involved in cell wall biosynthesis